MTQDASAQHERDIDLAPYVSEARTDVGVEVTSRKRLLEFMAASLARGSEEPEAGTIFQKLVDREGLGSTGVGQGIALPHGRVPGLTEARISIATLSTPIDYDSPDGVPVDIVFALLVPEEATAEHLAILARIAGIFSRADARREFTDLANADAMLRWLSS